VPRKERKEIILIPFIFILDQLAKFIINKTLNPNQSIPIIKNVFHLTLVYNRGAAFGIFKNQTLFFIVASILAIIFIYFNLRDSSPKSKLYILALSLIAGGTLGNLIDRLLLGYVIDFLDFRIWPVFNLADSAITIGAILLGYSMLREAQGN
jgi:signal peptidase II